MKTVGSRRTDGTPLDDQGGLARTAGALRRDGLAPRGVYRVASFEEADTWILQMMRRPRGRPATVRSALRHSRVAELPAFQYSDIRHRVVLEILREDLPAGGGDRRGKNRVVDVDSV